jgi:serine O-acetyltransferase
MDAADFYRLSAWLHRRGRRRAARLVKGASFFLFKASIPPELEAGSGFRLGHRGLGVVIHPNTTLGDDVFLQHNVTLATDLNLRDPRRMTVGDHVVFGTGAIVVGPVSIGSNVIVGAGAVVVRDVPSDVVVAGVPARIVNRRRPAGEAARG